MRYVSPGFRCILLFLIFLLSSSLHARNTFGNLVFDSQTKTEVTLWTPFDQLPSRGYVPVTVNIRNGSDRERTWSLSFRSELSDFNSNLGQTSSFRLVTPPTSETSHELLVPVAPMLVEAYNVMFSVSVVSGGTRRNAQIYNSIPFNWPGTAMSEGVNGTADNAEKFSTRVNSSHHVGHMGGTEPVVALFDAPDLPEDWRGYSGYDGLMLTDQEWLDLEEPAQRAIREWLHLGGCLYIFTENRNLEDLGFREDATRFARLSLGKVYLRKWNGRDIPIPGFVTNVENNVPALASQIREDYSGYWELQDLFGFRAFNPTLVFIILLSFAITVGPINLFVLAKPGMRHRLFFTTPIISLIASVLLVVLILFQDGFGGSGKRIGLMVLQPEQTDRRAFLVQEQISRTGVLLGRTFDSQDDLFMVPALMEASRWTHFDDSGRVSGSFDLRGLSNGGDWFQSRREQAHLIKTVRPTRARMERLEPAEDGSPRLFSSIEFPLERVFYVDQTGAVWRYEEEVRAGDEFSLSSSSIEALKAFWNDETEIFSESLRDNARELVKGKDVWFGVTARPDSQMVSSLSAIRWSRDRMLISGLPVESPSTTPAPQS